VRINAGNLRQLAITIFSMEYRHLGSSGLKVSCISYGGWLSLGSKNIQEESDKLIKLAYDSGINFFDNAEVYADGESEIHMGRSLRALGVPRSSYVVSTKIYWGGSSVNERGLSRKHIVEGLNESLNRFEMDYVDLVFAHRPDNLTPMEEIVRAFNWVIQQGKAFYWGTSEWSAEQIAGIFMIMKMLGELPTS
jgi:aryl-alcohol dehydrogenase-like predicted oxidoreductase